VGKPGFVGVGLATNMGAVRFVRTSFGKHILQHSRNRRKHHSNVSATQAVIMTVPSRLDNYNDGSNEDHI